MVGSEEEFSSIVGAKAQCSNCESEEVVRDAWASWNSDTGEWELHNIFDDAFCETCEANCELKWTRGEDPGNHAIRQQNDLFRQGKSAGGTVVITPGLQAKGTPFVLRTIQIVAAFNRFTEDNDPYHQHDFGSFDIETEKCFWKIDTYDLSMSELSPDPGDPDVTHRVLTIMFASEY